jgi:hypothetical protein
MITVDRSNLGLGLQIFLDPYLIQAGGMVKLANGVEGTALSL